MTRIKRTHNLVPNLIKFRAHPQLKATRPSASVNLNSRSIAAKAHLNRLPTELLHLIQTTLASKKAERIATVSLLGKTDIADAMVVASGLSSRHVCALARYIQDALVKAGYCVLGTDGEQTGEWVVIDACDVMIHLFTDEARETYQLEKMWRITFDQTPDDDASPEYNSIKHHSAA